jgi:hypothetical protein
MMRQNGGMPSVHPNPQAINKASIVAKELENLVQINQ